MPQTSATHICQFVPLSGGLFAFCFSPQHYCINQGFGLGTGDMTEGRDELVEVCIYTGPADKLYSCFWLPAVGHALADLLVRLADKLTVLG